MSPLWPAPAADVVGCRWLDGPSESSSITSVRLNGLEESVGDLIETLFPFVVDGKAGPGSAEIDLRVPPPQIEQVHKRDASLGKLVRICTERQSKSNVESYSLNQVASQKEPNPWLGGELVLRRRRERKRPAPRK